MHAAYEGPTVWSMLRQYCINTSNWRHHVGGYWRETHDDNRSTVTQTKGTESIRREGPGVRVRPVAQAWHQRQLDPKLVQSMATTRTPNRRERRNPSPRSEPKAKKAKVGTKVASPPDHNRSENVEPRCHKHRVFFACVDSLERYPIQSPGRKPQAAYLIEPEPHATRGRDPCPVADDVSSWSFNGATRHPTATARARRAPTT